MARKKTTLPKGIRELASGRYQARYSAPDGKRYNSPTTYLYQQDAVAWLAGEQKLMNLDAWTPPSERRAKKQAASRTVAEWVGEYYTNFHDYNVETTKNRYLRQIRHRIVEAAGSAAILRETPLNKMTNKLAHAWWDAVRSQWPDTETANYQAYQRLKAAMEAAVERELIDSNPIKIKKAAQRPKKLNGGNEYLTNGEEAQAVIDAMPEHYKLLASLCLQHGLRAGEALGLESRHVKITDGDTPTASIVIEQNSQRIEKRGEPVYMQLQPPKTPAGYRTVRIHDAAVPLLVRHLKEHASTSEQVMPTHRGPRSVKLLTVTTTGKPVMYTSFLSTFKRAVEKANADPQLHPHSGRHFINSTLAENGASPKMIGKILGESDLSTITQVYMHIREGSDAEVMRDLGSSIMPVSSSAG